MLKVINLIIASVFFQPSCTKIVDGNDAISEFVSSFEKEIYRDYGFNVFGSGASFPVKIEDIIICFQSNSPKDITEGRKLAVSIALRFIEKMNQDQNLKPYLANYPAELKNIDLTIMFDKDSKKSVDSRNCIHSIMIIGCRNCIVYSVFNEKKTMSTNVHRETFDEALKILQQESEWASGPTSNLYNQTHNGFSNMDLRKHMPGLCLWMQVILKKNLLNNLCPLMIFLLLNCSCSKINDGNYALDSFTSKFQKEVEKKYGFNLFGSGASFPKKIECIRLCFQTECFENIVGARRMAISLALELVERMNEDLTLVNYFANYPAELKNVNLTIMFNSGNKGASYKDNYIHTVMVIGSKNRLYYGIFNESRTMLIDLHEETFDEALEIIQQESE